MEGLREVLGPKTKIFKGIQLWSVNLSQILSPEAGVSQPSLKTTFLRKKIDLPLIQVNLSGFKQHLWRTLSSYLDDIDTTWQLVSAIKWDKEPTWYTWNNWRETSIYSFFHSSINRSPMSRRKLHKHFIWARVIQSKHFPFLSILRTNPKLGNLVILVLRFFCKILYSTNMWLKQLKNVIRNYYQVLVCISANFILFTINCWNH